MFSVHNPWDKLKTCIVGRSYPPEFYSFIQDPKVRSVMERIAIETEEDFQSLISVLESHGVEVLRPTIGSMDEHLVAGNVICAPPCAPRDYTAMVGDRFFIDRRPGVFNHFSNVLDRISAEGNSITYDQLVNTANMFFYDDRIIFGEPEFKDPEIWAAIRSPSWPQYIPREYVGKLSKKLLSDPKTVRAKAENIDRHRSNINRIFSNDYRCQFISGEDHIDACFSLIKPGLLVGMEGVFDYEALFPGWEIVYTDDNTPARNNEFSMLRNRNKGKWWVSGEENNSEFTEYVDSYLNHWLGYVAETRFDVNILMIDERTAVSNVFSDEMLAAFSRHDVTPIQVNFRHRYFWDGGIHCITSDINRG